MIYLVDFPCVLQAYGSVKLAINPHGTSQECSRWGHTHPDNRLSQARFECVSCGHMENADVNAARIIKARGISELTSGEFTMKNRKRAMRLRKNPY